MNQELPNLNKNIEQKEKEPEVLLYRGIKKTREGAIGHWWSTNPYYAFSYSNGESGEMYFIKIKKTDLDKIASDVSNESEYQNYLFKQDPPDTRKITQEELDMLKSHTTFSKLEGMPGGPIMKTPTNAIEIGKKIFNK